MAVNQCQLNTVNWDTFPMPIAQLMFSKLHTVYPDIYIKRSIAACCASIAAFPGPVVI